MSEIEIVFEGKEFKRIQARIKRGNVAFRKLPRAKQRVAIARDVIRMLDAQKIMASSTYLNLDGMEEIMDDDAPHEQVPLNEIIPTNIEKYGTIDASTVLTQMMDQAACEVCGIGSLFVAAVCRNDRMPLGEFMSGYECSGSSNTRYMETQYLARWFDARQCDLIEGYYEQHMGNAGGPILKQEDDNARLKMIMENIISNRGKFDPTRGRHRTE